MWNLKVKAGKERLNFSVYRQSIQNLVALSEYMNFTVKIEFIYSDKTTKFEKIPKCCLALLDIFQNFVAFSEYMNNNMVKIKFVYSEKAKQ